MQEYQGVKMSRVELDRIVTAEIARDNDIRRHDGALSAEEVVSERLRLHDWDAGWAWICLTELWQRWWPEKACLMGADGVPCLALREPAVRPYDRVSCQRTG